MQNVIDIRTTLEQLGTGWQFGGSVTDGTQAAWEAVTWEDARDKPAWAYLCTVYDKLLTKATILEDIMSLESQQTPRRLREAALTDAGKEWLQNLEDKIAAKREELSGL